MTLNTKHMEKIKVFLEAFYGYSCDGCGHGSEQNIEVEVDDAQLEALRHIGKEKITCEDITEAIDQGATVLEPMHEQLEALLRNLKFEARWNSM